MENSYEPPFDTKKLDKLLKQFLGKELCEDVGNEEGEIKNIVKKLHVEGISVELISNITGLTQEKIESFIQNK